MNKIKSLLAFAALLLCGGAWAATPVAVWDGDFTSLTKNKVTLANVGASANPVVGENGSAYIQIADTATKGVFVNWDNLYNVADIGFSGREVTVIVAYSDMPTPATNAKGAIFTLTSQVTTTSDNNSDWLGVMANSSGQTSAMVGSNSTWTHNSENPKGTFDFSADGQNLRYLAFSYKSSSASSLPTGTQLFQKGTDGNWTQIYGSWGLKGSTSDIRGCCIGGPRYVTYAGALQGLKIHKIAVFNSIVGKDGIAAYTFPSDLKNGYQKWAQNPAVLTWTGTTGLLHNGPFALFDCAAGADTATSFTGTDTNVKTVPGRYNDNTTPWNVFSSAIDVSPGYVLRFAGTTATKQIDAQWGELNFGGMIVEAGAEGYSFYTKVNNNTRNTTFGDSQKKRDTWYVFNESFTIHRETTTANLTLRGPVNIEVADQKTFTVEYSNPTLQDGATLRMHGLGKMVCPKLVATGNVALDFRDEVFKTRETAFIDGQLQVDGSTKIHFPAGWEAGAAHKLVLCTGTLIGAPSEKTANTVMIGATATDVYLHYDTETKSVYYTSATLITSYEFTEADKAAIAAVEMTQGEVYTLNPQAGEFAGNCVFTGIDGIYAWADAYGTTIKYVKTTDSFSLKVGTRTTNKNSAIRDTDTSVGGFPVHGKVWNNTPVYNENNTATTQSMILTSGSGDTADGVKAYIRMPNTWYSGANDAGNGNQRLTATYADDGGDAAATRWTIDGVELPAAPCNRGWQIRVANIPYDMYDLYIYVASDVGTVGNSELKATAMALSVNGGTNWKWYAGDPDHNATIAAAQSNTWKADPYSTGTLTEGTNYIKIRVSKAEFGEEDISTLDITHGPRNTDSKIRSSLAGIQIVKVDDDGIAVRKADTTGADWTAENMWTKSDKTTDKAWPTSGVVYAKIDADQTDSITVDGVIDANMVTVSNTAAGEGEDAKSFKFLTKEDLSEVATEKDPEEYVLKAPIDATDFHGNLYLQSRIRGRITLGTDTTVTFVAGEAGQDTEANRAIETTAFPYEFAGSNNPIKKVGYGTFIVPSSMYDRAFSFNEGAIRYDVAGSVSGSLTGSGKVVKSGTGTLVFSGNDLTTGGLEVQQGTVQLNKSGDFSFWDAETARPVSVANGAVLDINGCRGFKANVTLANGGVLASDNANRDLGDAASLYGIALEGDATVRVVGDFGLLANGYSATSLDLAGHTLTKSGDGIFFLCNTSSQTAGTIAVTAGTLKSYTTACSLPNVTVSMATGTTLDLAQNLTIGTLRMAGAVSLTGSGTLSANVELADDAVVSTTRDLDVSAWTVSSGKMIAKTGTAEEGFTYSVTDVVATITVDDVTTSYATVQAALDHASEGQTVVLKKSVSEAISISANVIVEMTADYKTTGTISGEGKLVLVGNGFNATQSANVPVPTGVTDSAKWTGTVEIRDWFSHGNASNLLVPSKFGNANSKLIINGYKGYVHYQNAAGTDSGVNLLKALELSGNGLFMDGSYSGTHQIKIKAETISGNGPIVCSIGNGNSSNFWLIGDASEYTGSVTANSNYRVVFAGAEDDTLPNHQNGTIAVGSKATVTLGSGTTWTTSNGVQVAGKLNLDGGTIANNKAISGSGEVVYDMKGDTTMPTANAGLTANAWTGTVTITNAKETKDNNFVLSNYGHAGSKIKFKGCSGYFNIFNKGTWNGTVVLEDNGSTPAWKQLNGGSGTFQTIGGLEGDGTWDGTGSGATQWTRIGTGENFRGTINFGQVNRCIVFGDSTVAGEDGTIIVGADKSVVIDNGKTWTSKTMKVAGTISGSGTIAGALTLQAGATIDTANGVLTASSTVDFGSELTVLVASLPAEGDLKVMSLPANAERNATVGGNSHVIVAGVEDFNRRLKALADGLYVTAGGAYNWTGTTDTAIDADTAWNGVDYNAQAAEGRFVFGSNAENCRVTFPATAANADTVVVGGNYTFLSDVPNRVWRVNTLATTEGSHLTVENMTVETKTLSADDWGRITLGANAKIVLTEGTVKLATGTTFTMASTASIEVLTPPELDNNATIRISDSATLEPGHNFKLISWTEPKLASAGYGKPHLNVEGYVAPENGPARLIPCAFEIYLQLRSAEQIARKPLTIMPFGDSITEGMNTCGNRANYRVQLFQKLSLAGYNVKSVGFHRRTNSPLGAYDPSGNVVTDEDWAFHSGVGSERLQDNTGKNGALYDSWANALDQAGDPDVILLHIGINDTPDNNNAGMDAKVEPTANGLIALVKKILVERPNSVLVMSSMNRLEYGQTFQKSATPGAEKDGNHHWVIPVRNKLLEFFNGVKAGTIECEGGERLYFADMCDKIRPRSYATFQEGENERDGLFDPQDHIHPDWSGHDIMAQTWFDEIVKAFPLSDGSTYHANNKVATNHKHGAINNVPDAYMKGFKKARVLTPNEDGSERAGTLTVANPHEIADATTVEKIGYYVEYEFPSATTNVHRWVWVDMDAFGTAKTVAEAGLPTSGTTEKLVTSLHVASNHPQVYDVLPTENGVKGIVEFSPYKPTNGTGTSETGAPDHWFGSGSAWNDAVNTSNYGSMQIHRVFPQGSYDNNRPAQVLFCYNAWNCGNDSKATELGIGSFGQHFVACTVDWVNMRNTETMHAGKLNAKSIEIWVKPTVAEEETETTVDPSEDPVEVTADSEQAALDQVTIVVSDGKADDLGQAALLKKVATDNGNGTWSVRVEVNEAAIVDGVSKTVQAAVEETAVEFAQQGLESVAGATETTHVDIPAAKVIPGLYYSVSYGTKPDNHTEESDRVLATGSNVTIPVPALGNEKVYYIKIKASATTK